MFQIPTLYTNYQELLLDLDIYGKILTESSVNKDELKGLLFEEYKVTHPLPTLEDKRYELSDLVSSDYHISYANDLELAENEELVDLGALNKDEEDFDVDGNIIVPDSIKESYKYGSITDRVREELIEKYLLDDGDEFSGDVEEAEGVFNTVESKAEIYSEDESDDYSDGFDYIEDDSEDYDDGSDYSYNEEEYSEEDEYEDDDDSEEYEDDDSDEYEYEDGSEEYEYEDDDSDDYEYEDDDSDEYEDVDSEEYEYGDEDSEEGYDSNDEYKEEDIYIEGSNYYNKAENSSKYVDVNHVEIKDEVSEVNIPTPADIVLKNKESSSKVVIDNKKEKVDRDSEPKDLREFVRKYPRCEVSFALQYFSRKEIEKYLMMGKVIKKGTKLHI